MAPKSNGGEDLAQRGERPRLRRPWQETVVAESPRLVAAKSAGRGLRVPHLTRLPTRASKKSKTTWTALAAQKANSWLTENDV